MVNDINFKIAFEMLDDYYEKTKNSIIYYDIPASLTFSNIDISQALYSISDESYRYVLDNVKSTEYSTLFNIFSGSGRFIKELDKLNLLDNFSAIYNIDSSIEMISFEKSKFHNFDTIRFICEDFLNLNVYPSNKNLIVCHCGIRYLKEEQLYSFVQKIKQLLTGNSVCFISETKKSIIDLLIDEINKSRLEYEFQEEDIIMHRNTKMYVAFWLYYNNKTFQLIINKISCQFNKLYYETLKEVSGYKKDKLFILKLSQVL